jgi:hypothetical protein
VSGVPRYHWQGNLPGLGSPVHPTKKLSASPAVYEFDEPGASTYAVWYDPAYWNQGVRVVFNWKFLARQVLLNSRVYYEVLLREQWFMAVACVLLFLVAGRGRAAVSDIGEYWMLLVPAIAALALYAPVHVEERMIGSFVVLLWMALFSSMRLETGRRMRKFAVWSLVVVMAALMSSLVGSAFAEARTQNFPEPRNWTSPDSQPQWQVVKELYDAGVQPGDKVAWIRPSIFDGNIQNYAWARLAKIRIIAEIPSPEAKNFWKLQPNEREKVFGILSQTGAVAFIVTKMPEGADLSQWKPLGSTGYFEHVLRPAEH